ncbi:MAG: S8 family serine peptidase [Geminicoccaceae bacterium]|nr:S8 family serine peptidase [Geminicoccaceae bacterium]MDW8369341.1 S8 family serine peptidase [Geminicoccaceae bacterium]
MPLPASPLTLSAVLAMVAMPAAAGFDPDFLRRVAAEACAMPAATLPVPDGLRLVTAANDGQRNDLLELERASGERVRIRRQVHAGRVRGVIVEHHAASGTPVAIVHTDAACRLLGGRRIVEDGLDRFYEDLDPSLAPIGERVAINPAPPSGRPTDGVAVALVDSGVNYLLPQLAAHWAYGPDGRLAGLDLVDGDERPFDLDQSRNAFFPRRHGTAVASILAREAPAARILPYRFGLERADGFARIVAHAKAHGARIVLVPLGNGSIEDWAEFREVAAANPDLLFVVSAGNNARDIDAKPVYPAAFGLPNQLTVGSCTGDGRIAPDSNWAARTVDLFAPGEGVWITDAEGRTGAGFGTSFAAPRIAALAARLLAAEPSLDAAGLKAAILARAEPMPPHPQGLVMARHGWIADPAAR